MLSLDRQEALRERYARENVGWRPATHVYRDRVARWLSPASRLLDLGCGRGGIVEELHTRAGLVVGVDVDFRSLQRHRLSDLPRLCGEGACLPFSDAAFDVVCCSWVLEHLPDPAAVLAEVARVLRPGGRFVFLTPNRDHPLLILNRALRWTQGRLVHSLYGRAAADTFPALYRANRVRELTRLIDSAGLEAADIVLVGDPTYLAFNEAFYRFACVLERLLPRSRRVHIVGEAYKPPARVGLD